MGVVGAALAVRATPTVPTAICLTNFSTFILMLLLKENLCKTTLVVFYADIVSYVLYSPITQMSLKL